MVNRIIKEVKTALDNECYIVALMGALTLPDICGKSAYPNLSVGERYRNWCDAYVYPKIQHTDEDRETLDCGIIDLSGRIIYSLRCCLLHQGSVDIDGKKCEVEDFELLIQPQNEFNFYADNFGVIWSNDDYEHRERHMSLHIRNICNDLCNAAKLYYRNNKASFGFIKYKISQIDPNAEHPWDYSKEMPDEWYEN
jgi:hypothetical protein